MTNTTTRHAGLSTTKLKESFCVAILRKLGIDGQKLKEQFTNADIGDPYALWDPSYNPYQPFAWAPLPRC